MINGIGGLSGVYSSQMNMMQKPMGNTFDDLDSDGDGALDTSELSTMADQLSQGRGPSVTVDQLVSRLDSDEDGLVSREELEAGRPQGPPPPMGGMPPRIDPFDEFDSDEDDSLDEEEFGAFAEKVSEITGQAVDDIISELDTDGDDILSREEFEAGRPQDSLPGMMGLQGRGQGQDVENLFGLLNSSELESSSVSVDSFDTNGDGAIDAEEMASGINLFIQEYLGQLNDSSEETESGSLLDEAV